MALSLNQEIKKYSDQLSSDTGGELGNFASTIESGLEGVKGTVTAVATGLSSEWKDVVSARTINLMQTANSKIDTQKDSINTIKSASAAVATLKLSADIYVAAYDSYKSSEYYHDSPPASCKNEDSWRSEKRRIENSIKEKEDAVLSVAQSVKSLFSSSSDSSSDGSSSDAKITTLSGSELKQFCDKNLVDQSRVIVEKATLEVDGAEFEVYYVYDKNLQSREFENEAFRLYANDCVNALGKVDDDLLKKLDSTNIIFEQTYACDRGHKEFGMKGVAQAWYWADTHTVTTWFPSFGTSDGSSSYDYGVNSIIHEFGHVMDSTLGHSQTGYYQSFETEDPSLSNSKWSSIIERESQTFRKLGIEGLCPSYSYEKYKDSHSEYLAEFFYAYNMGYKELLKDNCPETYKEVERIMEATKKIKG